MQKLTSEEAYTIRDQLLNRWGYDGLEWEPYEDKSTAETIFIAGDNLTTADYASILNRIKAEAKWPVYLISAEAESEVSESEFHLNLYQEICCDSTLDWVVYSSYSAARTFGGRRRLQYIRDLYDDREHLLNDWGNMFI